MKTVFEWLDKNIHRGEKDSRYTEDEQWSYKLKKNGHWEVFGGWNLKIDDANQFGAHINNETIHFRDIIHGYNNEKENTALYGYLKTYDHIPRGEADINGYYQRSTPEEIIRYMSSRLDILKEYKEANHPYQHFSRCGVCYTFLYAGPEHICPKCGSTLLKGYPMFLKEGDEYLKFTDI